MLVLVNVLLLFATCAFGGVPAKQRGTNNTSKRQTDLRELWRKAAFSSHGDLLAGMSAQHVWGRESLSAVADPAGGSGEVLRVHYDAGSYSHTHDRDSGAGFYATPAPSHTVMMLSFDVYFSPNFDFVKGGKLPGLWGGITNTCSGGRHSDDCFSTRFMFRANGQGEVYAYIPKEQDAGFCDRSDVHCNFESGHSLGRGKWTFKKGQWQNIAQYVHLNTPGHHDGYIRVFLDGHNVFEINNLNLRNHANLLVDGILFSTFFGGGDSSWATPHSVYSYFRNFVLSMDAHTPVIIG